ncbi:MAG: F0F1 ATP synthase subunit epsilon [Actinobacteria bacterium]|nr:F0F1 ATP synthase subunit epsilon [Actinomycetota bacterium]
MRWYRRRRAQGRGTGEEVTVAEGSTLEVAVVSAERLLWQGEAKSVVAKTPEGEIGILPGHEPVLALLLESPLRIEESDGNKMMVAVHGGFFSVDSNKVNVIAEVAELAEDIDLERAQAALSRAQAAGDETEDPSALKRAETRITVAGTAKGLS